ncbi:hypothetical protein ACFP81_10990 [Deinococcus lacus]|uniref:Uncharacterized protein n=1 Tax=Deinococcus lacus TaxID=392561 RepID=A0ABW1YG09_9DEIO
MIRYRKQNLNDPEQDSEIAVDLTPFIFIAAGYIAVKVLLRTLD